MLWGDKRYHSLNYELKRIFGTKVVKLSVDGGFTCPNRDGTAGDKGCIFCGEEGSGEFTFSKNLSIPEQIAKQKEFMSKKWATGKYIAYFQNFTNTYGDTEYLKEKYYAGISQKGMVGLAIATRPDSISPSALDLLEEINKKTYLWIELGLQTIHDTTANFIRRGYDLCCYEKTVEELKKRNIRIVTHLIFGLPGESKQDILESVKYVSERDTWGIKIHLLYIQRGTDLHKFYMEHPFHILTKEEYVNMVCDSIEIIPKDMIIHRLTGDGKKALLIEPKWSLDKLKVLSDIDKELSIRNSYQGKFFK